MRVRLVLQCESTSDSALTSMLSSGVGRRCVATAEALEEDSSFCCCFFSFIYVLGICVRI